MGAQPTHRLIRKNAAGKWDTIGAAWQRDDEKSYSVTIELQRGGEKIKCLLVENKPKAGSAKPEPSIEDSESIPF